MTAITESTALADLDELGARIPFGPRPNQSVPASWASVMLTLLAERYQPVFIALMGEAATGYKAEIRQRRNSER